MLATAILLSGCGSAKSPFSVEPPVERNILTGEPGTNGQVIAVKFDDTRFAHPQKGVESADVVFVTQVEGGLTRLLGIFTSNYPDLVGPVRSARISDIDILAQFGRVGFMYSGAQTKMHPILDAANIVNLSAERNPPTIYIRDPNRNSPYDMMVKIPELMAKAEGVDTVKSIGWEHGEISESATAITSVKVNWPSASYEAVWNAQTNKFDLVFDGAPNLDSDGQPLGSNSMVIQLIEITPSEFGDKFGGITPKSHVIGSGAGYLLRDGTITSVRWSRDDATSETIWTLPDGSPALFATGQVWLFLTDKEPTIKYPVANSPEK